MKHRINRRIFVVILAVILVWNSIQIPGSIPRVSANGLEMTNVQENIQEQTGKTVSGNAVEAAGNLDIVSTNDIDVKNKDTVSENNLLVEETTEETTEVEGTTEAEETTEVEGTTEVEETTEVEGTTEAEETTEVEGTTEAEGTTETEEFSAVEETSEEVIETEEESAVMEETTVEEATTEELFAGAYKRSENTVSLFSDIWVEGFEKESESLCYTGEAVTQNLQIYHNGNLLKEGKDYKLTYKNNVNAGAYHLPNAPSVRISMMGQYSGNQTLYFTIVPRDITDGCAYETEQLVYYKKKLSLSVPDIFLGNRKLTYTKDFDCDYTTLPQDYKYGDSYEEGVEYEYTVTGKGNFTGSYTVKLIVLKDKSFDFHNAKVELDKECYEYSGVAFGKADVVVLSVKAGKTELPSEFYDYNVFADGPENAYVKVYPTEAGKEAGYAGVKELPLTVVGDRKIEDAIFGTDWQESIVFSKKALDEQGGIFQKEENLLVYGNDSEVLIEGVDYTVSYYNHGKTGRASVIFTGIGRYRGTLEKTYEIIPNMDLQTVWQQTDVSGNPVVLYTKGETVPKFSLVENAETEAAYALKEKIDYTVKFSDNKQVGFMTCEITGKGNFKGYSSVYQIEILNGDIGAGTIEVEDRVFSEKENAWKATVAVKDANGTKLKAGTDYDKNLIFYYEGMDEGKVPEIGTTIQVTAVGINQFVGSSITAEYRICAKKLNELVIKIDDQVYTGSAIELKPEDIHVYESWLDYFSGVEMTEPCYEITGYSDNKNIGKATVILRGMGDCGGEKTYSFKIEKMKYEPVRVTDVVLDETDLLLGVDSKRQLNVSVFPQEAENKTIMWMTTDERIASVDSSGRVTAKKPGKVTIMAVSQDGGKKASCDVTVAIIPVQDFILNVVDIYGFEGTTFQLHPLCVLPEDATISTIQWESSRPEIASVDESGKVSLNQAGMAVISAYSADRSLVRKCMVYVEKEGEEKPEGNYLTPQMFRTYNEADDTKSFNKAIQNLNESCNTLYVPAGTYFINAETSIKLKSNMNLVMSEDAVLQALGNSNSHSDVLYVRAVNNVSISGGNIRGERYQHKGSSGEWGMGIGIYDSTNVQVDGVRISNCWGDGIYIGSKHDQDSNAGSSAIRILNSYLFNNRRNNLSIVCGDYVTVNGCAFEYANGTAPEYGIDIETNNSNNPCEHITISNSTFKGNAEAALGIVTAADDIRIEGCTLNGAFINYAGTNVTLSNTTINGKMYARIGVNMEDGSVVNDGSNTDDELILSYSASGETPTLGQYGINGANQMSGVMVDDADSTTGKALQLKRLTTGTQESGFYLDLNELTGGLVSALKAGVTYRFEYTIKGSGFWGIKTNQTAWYPMVLTSEGYTTGFATYKAKNASSCQILFYAIDKVQDMILEIESIKIYEVR